MKLEGKELQAARARALERALETARAKARAERCATPENKARSLRIVREFLQGRAESRDRPGVAISTSISRARKAPRC